MKSKKILKLFLIWCFLSSILSFFVWQDWLSTPQDKLTDLLFTKEAPTTPILIVAIDEESLQAIGQWPWPRSVFANLIKKLQSAKVIGIDVNFKEPSRLGFSDDQTFNTALRTSRTPVVLTSEITSLNPVIITWPLAILQQSVFWFTGYANVITDTDATVRRVRLVIENERSFAARISSYYNDLTDSKIPTDFATRVHYRGPEGTFSSLPVSDVLNGKIPISFFQDKIILIGTTVRDLHDTHSTPFGLMSGVEVQANVVDTIITQNFFHSSITLTVVSIFFLSFLAICLSNWFKKFLAILGALIVLIVVYNLVVFISFDYDFILDLLYPNLAIILSAALTIIFNYVTTSREKKFIQESFSRYLAPQVINELLANPARLRLGGERRTLTILFSDIRGFTSLAEIMAPETLTQFLSRYLGKMTNIILEERGVIDKYIGDAIMAFWGAPLPDPDHAMRALLAALNMVSNLNDFNLQNRQNNVPEINIGIGLNSGEVIVGNMGSEKRFDYTVIGDDVNLASRLESLTKEYGVNIMVSEKTLELITPEQQKQHELIFRELDRVKVKGKQKPIRIFELIPISQRVRHQRERADFDQAREAYYQGKWSEALETFKTIANDGPAAVLAKRCQQFLENPPKDWQGIFELMAK